MIEMERTAGHAIRPDRARRSWPAPLLLALAGPIAGQNVEPPPVPFGRVPPPGAYAEGFDALHYRIAIELPDTGTFILGTTAIDIRLTGARRDTLILDLSGLRVRAVRAGTGSGALRPTEFRQFDGRVGLPVPPEAKAGDTLRVVVDYDGTPDDGLFIRPNTHGRRSAFADNFPDRGRFWFPSIDHPSDKATVEYAVRAPAGWEVVGNGRRLGAGSDAERPADGVWRWRIDAPIPTYTMVIGASDFAVGTVTPCARGGLTPLRPDGCVPVSYWAYPQDSASAAVIFARAGEMVEYYADRFGPYPYHKLAHVQSSTRFGGMENSGAIFYSEQAIAGGSLGEVTVAHETAHQWFGDGVTETVWNHAWLSEGFATYFGMQFFEKAEGSERFRELLDRSASGYLRSQVTDLAMVDTLSVPDGNLMSLLNANSYNKGGQVLHMLRGLLGDEAFFRGIGAYYRRHANGNALTADLQHALEEASGTRLDWFFDQWAYRPGHPVFRVTHAWDAGAGEAEVVIEQVQKAGWPTFRVPMEIAFETPTGEVRRKVEVRERTARLRFPLAAAPSAVRIDPDGWVLKEVR